MGSNISRKKSPNLIPYLTYVKWSSFPYYYRSVIGISLFLSQSFYLFASFSTYLMLRCKFLASTTQSPVSKVEKDRSAWLIWPSEKSLKTKSNAIVFAFNQLIWKASFLDQIVMVYSCALFGVLLHFYLQVFLARGFKLNGTYLFVTFEKNTEYVEPLHFEDLT